MTKVTFSAYPVNNSTPPRSINPTIAHSTPTSQRGHGRERGSGFKRAIFEDEADAGSSGTSVGPDHRSFGTSSLLGEATGRSLPTNDAYSSAVFQLSSAGGLSTGVSELLLKRESAALLVRARRDHDKYKPDATSSGTSSSCEARAASRISLSV